MKKMLAFALAFVLAMSMVIPAVALEELALAQNGLLPPLHESSSNLVIFYSMEDLVNLSEENQKLMEEAQEKLDEARVDHLTLKYFCLVETVGSEDGVAVVFDSIEHNQIAFKQYVDGAWQLLDHTANADGTMTVAGVVDGPLAIFTNDMLEIKEPATVIPGKRDSAGAQKDRLLPGGYKTSSSMVLLHSTEMVPHLSEEVQNLMAEAKEQLKDACPAGFAVKYFCYVEIVGADASGSVVCEKLEFTKIQFAQYVDGEWVELSHKVNADGTITVDNVQEGPMAIFIK